MVGDRNSIENYNSSHVNAVKMTNELVGTSTHHDTITGTSPTHVI